MILHLRLATAIGPRTVIAHCGEQDGPALCDAIRALGGAAAVVEEQGGKSLGERLRAYRKKKKEYKAKMKIVGLLPKNVTNLRTANAKS